MKDMGGTGHRDLIPYRLDTNNTNKLYKSRDYKLGPRVLLSGFPCRGVRYGRVAGLGLIKLGLSCP